MFRYIVFILGTICIGTFSRRSLFRPRSHGFYRFIAWELLLAMFLLNVTRWFEHPFAWNQILSWAFLFLSLYLVIEGVILLRKIGQQTQERQDVALHGWEKTSQLVTVGLYKYIRHPLYSSLLFLGWGIYLKSPSWYDFGLVFLVTGFLTLTARVEEVENINYFGEEYRVYQNHTKMFIPYLF